MSFDLVTFGETMLRLSPPEGERLERTRSLDVHPGGSESNVATAAARLGADAMWMSKLPDSPLGRRVTSELNSNGLRTGVAWSDEGRMGTYYIEYGGKPRGTNVIYDRENAAIQSATPDELSVSAVENAEMFFTSGITPGLSETLAETTATLLRRANEAGTKTVFDLNYRTKIWSPEVARAECESLFPNIDVLVVAQRDAVNVLGVEGDAVEIANHLQAQHDFETVIVTRGDQGALALHEGTIHEQPVYEADTFDAIGTGDAFVGGFLRRRIAGDNVGEALDYGAATASLKRTIEGDMAIVTPEEVEAVIEEGSQGISR